MSETNPTPTTTDSTTTAPRKVSHSVAAQLNQAEEMLAGLAMHQEALSKWGVDTTFITKFGTVRDNARNAHNTKLANKARMMEQAALCQQHLAEMERLYAIARIQVKLEFPKQTWREFGITDQR